MGLNNAMKYILNLTYLTIVLLPAVFWWENKKELFQLDLTVEVYLNLFGQLAGLIGLSMMFMQMVIAARKHWIERWYGQDRLMRYHRTAGLVTLLLLLIHPSSFYIAYWLDSYEAFMSFLLPSLDWKSLGVVSLNLLILTIILALWSAKFKIKYHWWKRIHYITYLAMLGGYLHSLFLGSDLLMAGNMRNYWYFLGGIVVLSFLHLRIWKPLLAKMRPYSIESIRKEANGVRTFIINKSNTHSLNYAPGQFLYIKFISKDVTTEWHPFTISSSPTDDTLMVSIKASGDWTSTLDSVMPGDRVQLMAPYGTFNFERRTSNTDIVFIAGGIGITPFRSMLRYIADKKLPHTIHLLYGNQTRDDIAFHDELDALDKQFDAITVTHVLSKDKTWDGAKGRIDTQCLEKYVSDIDKKDYFICGPPAMMKAVKQSLRDLGVSKNQIHTEEFSLK